MMKSFTCLVTTIALVLSVPAWASQRHNAGGVEAEGRYSVVFPMSAALPDPKRTPGAINPDVSQANLADTICRKGGYTRSIRPPESYTGPLKKRQIREYGYTDYRMRDYEEDHLISLELGGSPNSPKNLWPEPHHVIGGWGSYAKDKLENRLHTLVCHHKLFLVEAQQEIATDWIGAYKRYVASDPSLTHGRRKE